MSEFEQTKIWLVETLHLERDALHVYVALLVFFGTCLLFRWKAWQWKPWLCVLGAALAGEVWDIAETIAAGQALGLRGSLKDIVNTLAVPSLILLTTRVTPVFGPPRGLLGGRLRHENQPM